MLKKQISELVKMMKIDVISLPVCQQCNMVKKILEKFGIDYVVEEHVNPELDEYPLVVIDGEKYSYHSFLTFVNNGGLNKEKV